jgi:hypothetical protein
VGRIYKYSGAFQGKVWRFRDVIIGDKGSLLEQSRYKWITVGANQEGVYFVAPLVFHPKLFIPWEDVTITYCEGLISLWGYPVKLEFRQAPLVWFRITENLAKQLVGVAGLSLSR